MGFLGYCALALKVFSSGSWSVNVLPGKVNSNGESYLRFNTLGGVFLTFKRIVSGVGKSRITTDKLTLLLLPLAAERFLMGDWKRKKTAGLLVSHCSFISVLTSITQFSILCRAVWGDEQAERRRWGPCARGA